MRDAVDIRVKRAIIHLVNHRKDSVAIPSEAELSLTSEPVFQEYLSGRVKSALSDAATSSAKFIDAASHPVAKHCYQLLEKKGPFVSVSQELARLLFNAMSVNRSISPGSLIVCLCSAAHSADVFLALIKVDPSDQLRLIEESDGKGRRIVKLEVSEKVLPSEREKLQKAAIIQPKRPKQTDAPYDLLLLDRQTEKVMANFFAKGFLNAEPMLDARERTKRLYTGYIRGLKRLTRPPKDGEPALIKPEEAVVLRQQIDVAINSRRINVPDMLDNLNLPDQARQLMTDEISRQLPHEQEFEIDPEHAQSLVKRLSFRGGFGVHFEVEADHWGDVVKSLETVESTNGRSVSRLIIEVPDLEMEK